MADNKNHKVLFITPGASYTGAPILFSHMLAWLNENTSITPVILTSGSGPLEKKYNELATVYKWDNQSESNGLSRFYIFRLFRRILKKINPIKEPGYKEKLLKILEKHEFDLIYANSVASFEMLREIKRVLPAKVICHVRELEISIVQFCGKELFKSVLPFVDVIIADSEAVKQNLIDNHGVEAKKVEMVYEFIILSDAANIIQNIDNDYNSKLRSKAGVPEDAFIVASSGTTDWRKGADLIVHIAKRVFSKSNFPVHFIWIGGDSLGLEFQKLNYDLAKLNLQDRIHFLGVKETPMEYFQIADIFMLCSREEPVGIVALEAASLGKPILCFDKAGGLPEFVGNDCGFVLQYLDLDAMADHIILLMSDRALLRRLGDNAAIKVKQHDINIACRKIEALMNSTLES